MILTYNLLRKKIDIDLQLSMLSNDVREIDQAIKIHEIQRISLGLAQSYTELFFIQKGMVWDDQIKIKDLDNIIYDLQKQNQNRRFTADKYSPLLNALIYAKDTAIFLLELD